MFHYAGCIDLTSSQDEEFVDLTNDQNSTRSTIGSNDASLVVGTATLMKT